MQGTQQCTESQKNAENAKSLTDATMPKNANIEKKAQNQRGQRMLNMQKMKGPKQ